MKARWAPVGATLLAVGLYVATLSRSWSADSLLYALDIESGEVARMLDPYHLLLHPAGWAFYRLWQWAGWSGGSLLPLQVLNALGGAVCVGLVYGTARHLTGSARAAALAAAGVAVSGGLWLLSVEAEFVTIPLAAHLAVLWCVMGAPQERARRPAYALGLGLAIILAAMTYLSGLLLVGVVVTGFLLQQRWPWSIRLPQAAIAAGAVLGAAVCGLALFLIARSGRDLAEWLYAFWGGGVYGQLSWFNLPHGAYAFLCSLALYPGLVTNESTRAFLSSADPPQRALFVTYYLIVLAAAMLPLVLAWRWRDLLWARHRRELAVLAVWTVLYGAFAVYWVPGDFSFWMPLLAAWWLVAALLLPRLRHGAALMLTLVMLLLLANALVAILPRHDLARNARYRLAMELSAHTMPADLIWLGGDSGFDSLYATYFGRREVVSLSLPDAQVENLAPWFGRTAGEVRQRRGRIFAAGFPLEREGVVDLLCASAGRVLGQPCLRRPATWRLQGAPVWELCPPEQG